MNLVNSSDRVVAATPPAVERNISDWLVQRAPGEFDDAPSVPPGSNPQAPPFPQDPGPNQPVRPDFDNPGSGSSADRAIEPDGVTMTDARALSSDTFEFTLRSPEDCILTATFKTVDSESFFETARYVPSTPDACGSKTYSFDFQERGQKIVATSSSNEIVILEKLSSKTGRLIYQEEGKNIQKDFPLDSNSFQSKTNNEVLLSSNIILLPPSQKGNKTNIVAGWTDRYTQYEDKIACGTLRGLCDVVPFMQAAALIAVATGIGSSVSPLIFLLHYLGSVGCYMVFGGIPPLPLNSVIGRGLKLGKFGQDTLTALNVTNRISVRTPLGAAGIAGAKLPGFDGPWKNLCKKREKPQGQQTAQQPQQPPQQQLRACRVTGVEKYNNMTMNRGGCAIQGPVMTEDGPVDGKTQCGICNTFIGGLAPRAGSCQEGVETDPRIAFLGLNKPILCPPNWDSGY
ncbi:MAG: hypothetical protein JGK23_15695 [Microcoleus sp. PH2017_19_SFW_U_A]|nr:hypothetical protein [Microcoleus sp. PH2017_19_SFW_U_A]